MVFNGSDIRTGSLSGTTGGRLESSDSLDLMKDEIIESTSSLEYFNLEKIDLSSLLLCIQPQKVISLRTDGMHDLPLFLQRTFYTYDQSGSIINYFKCRSRPVFLGFL